MTLIYTLTYLSDIFLKLLLLLFLNVKFHFNLGVKYYFFCSRNCHKTFFSLVDWECRGGRGWREASKRRGEFGCKKGRE